MKLFLIAVTLVLSCASFQRASAAPELSVVTKLDMLEPFDAMAFHDGFLFVGKSRKDHDLFYSVELYDTDSKLLSSVMLKHRADHMYPYGSNAVLVTGVTPYPTHSRYTIIKRVNQKIQIAEEKEYPIDITTDRFVGYIGNAKFFTVPGGKLEGLDDPRESILVQTGSSYRFLKPLISYPGPSAVVGGKLLVVEEGGPGAGDDNLMTIDPSTQVAKRFFPKSNRMGFRQVVMLNNQFGAVSELEAGKVLIADVQNTTIAKEITVPQGTPRTLDKFGKCLVIGSDESKKITFVKWLDEKSPVVAEWDLSPLGKDFFRLRQIAVDEAHKTVYARSATPCNPMVEACTEERNSVVKAKVSDDSLAACLN